MRYIALGAIIILFSLPTFGFASGLIPCDGPDCQACHFVKLGQNVLEWLIGIMASIIALVFAIGGMKMVMSGGSSENVSEAKSMMTNSVVGFVILLSAWLIIDTSLKLFMDESKLGVWNEVACVKQPEMLPQDTPSTATTTAPTAECSDDAGLIAKYGGSSVGQENSGLRTMIQCYLQDSSISSMVDSSKIYTVDQSHPRCSLTNGNPVCGSCSHSSNSCHYGRGHGTGSMAVDFNAKSGVSESELYSKIQARQSTCGGTLNFESNHTHISMSGC